MDHKAQVEHYLKTDRTLLGGRNLYNKLPGKSRAFQNALTRFTPTAANLDKLHYQLAKTVGLPQRNLKMLLQKPVVAAKVETAPVDTAPVTLDDKLIAFDAKTSNYREYLQVAKDLKLELADNKKKTVFKALTAARAELVKKK